MGADSFTYTLSDGRGGTAAGSVTVAVGSANGSLPFVISITRTSASVVVIYAGVPGSSYQPQYADTLSGSTVWTNLGAEQTAGANGRFTSTDATQPQPPRRFYHTIAAP